jgi:hypothetical protein
MVFDTGTDAALTRATLAIAAGGSIGSEELVALLCQESRQERFRANAELTSAYLRSGRLEEASEFAERAWLLSDASLSFLPLYLEIQNARGAIERIREAYKRVGIHAAAAGRLAEALEYFNLHHYAYQRAGRGDRYDYDLDILGAIEHLAAPYRPRTAITPTSGSDGRTRIGYLVFGATHNESVLIKLLCYFARFHDSSRFDVRFFVPDRKRGTKDDTQDLNRSSNIRMLESNGGQVEFSDLTDETERLHYMVAKLTKFQPHLLVTTAVLADYSHYFLASVAPAFARVGLVYGPPEQYVAPGMDWAVTATKHPLIDIPCGGTRVPVEVELPDRGSVVPHEHPELGVPADATLVVVTGRPEKFIDRSFWAALSGILSHNQTAFLLIVGLGEEPAFVHEILPADTRSRLRILGYRKNYLRILAMADLVLDTFPSGGGVVLLDAMALGIPVVTFRNDYAKRFDQTRWSPGEELFDVAELIVNRGDFGAFQTVATGLIEDPEYRRRMGMACQASVLRLNGQPERMVRGHEQVYVRILDKIRSGEHTRTSSTWIPLPVPRVSDPLRSSWSVRVLRRARLAARRILQRILARV